MSVKKAQRPKRKVSRRLAEVVGIYPQGGQFTTEMAHARVSELVANTSVKGIIVISLDKNGDVETRLFGSFKRSDIMWAGHELLHEAFESA